MTVNGHEYFDTIEDGYTASGYINEGDHVHGLRGELSFTYRPMLPAETDAVDVAISQRSAAEGSKAIVAAIKTHLVDWDAKSSKGEPLPVTVDNIQRLPHSIYHKLYRIIAGHVLSDLPRGNQGDDYVSTITASVESGELPGDVAREADLKN